jgi:hypothetical protein
LSNNQQPNEVAQSFCDLLEQTNSLRRITARNLLVRCFGVTNAIFSALAQNQSIRRTELVLIGLDYASLSLSGLNSNAALRKLSLTCYSMVGRLTDLGAELAINTNLQSLELDYSSQGVSLTNVTEFLKVACHNRTLEKLWIRGVCILSTTSVQSLHEWLRQVLQDGSLRDGWFANMRCLKLDVRTSVEQNEFVFQGGNWLEHPTLEFFSPLERGGWVRPERTAAHKADRWRLKGTLFALVVRNLTPEQTLCAESQGINLFK